VRLFLERVARNWRLKLAALGIALLLWSVVKAEEIVSVYVRGVPVSVSLRQPGWEMLQPPAPARVTVLLTGPVREVLRLGFERPRIVVPVEDVRDSVLVSGLRADWVHLSGDLARTRVDDIVPAAVRLTFRRIGPAGNGRARGVRAPPAAAPPPGGPAVLVGPPAAGGPVSPVPPAESVAVPPHHSAGARGDSSPAPAPR